MVEMMYRLRHCASYHTIKEIENEMAAKSVKATPFRLSLNVSAATGVASKTVVKTRSTTPLV